MKNTLLLAIMLIASKLSFSQENNNKMIPPPLYVVISASGDSIKGKTVLFEPREFKKINILKGAEALNKYGGAGENGVVEITLKSGAEILDLDALKKFYKIVQYPNVHISIDGSSVSPTSLIVTQKAIKDIKKRVVKENEEINIEITSWHPIEKLKPGRVRIRQ